MYDNRHHNFEFQYNHKFGFHINGFHREAITEALKLKPKVVKLLDFSVETVKQIRLNAPDTFIIGRLALSGHKQNFGNITHDSPHQLGRAIAQRILDFPVNHELNFVDGKPLINAWESYNEVLPEHASADLHRMYNDFQVGFGQIMLHYGFNPIAMNFGQGNGRGKQWLDLYAETLDLYDYLGFHEYDYPTMDYLHNVGLNGPDELHNRVSGGEGRGNDGMWRCLRYRRIMNEGIRQAYNDKHTVIITECGMTQGVWSGADDVGPWHPANTIPDSYDIKDVQPPIPVSDYWETLQWYNSELMKDDYVMGACLFVTGATGKPEWKTFEHVGTITPLIEKFQKRVDKDDKPLNNSVDLEEINRQIKTLNTNVGTLTQEVEYVLKDFNLYVEELQKLADLIKQVNLGVKPIPEKPTETDKDTISKWESPYIYGIHDPGGEHLLNKKGWVLVTEELGHNPHDYGSKEYTRLEKQGLSVIVRLNNRYGPEGTIPHPDHYQDFAKRCESFVHYSSGCHIWIVGNEINMEREQPRKLNSADPNPITPELYAKCYKLVRNAIKSLPNRENDLVIVAPIAPWNNQTAYKGNDLGDWCVYLTDMLKLIGRENCDGIAIHAYTHGYDRNLVQSTMKMNPPFNHRHYHFYTYKDQMHSIPEEFRDLPVYLTEMNGDVDSNGQTWPENSRGFIQAMYEEINHWNQNPETGQKIRCGILFRWIQDRLGWGISGKSWAESDIRESVRKEYTWT